MTTSWPVRTAHRLESVGRSGELHAAERAMAVGLVLVAAMFLSTARGVEQRGVHWSALAVSLGIGAFMGLIAIGLTLLGTRPGHAAAAGVVGITALILSLTGGFITFWACGSLYLGSAAAIVGASGLRRADGGTVTQRVLWVSLFGGCFMVLASIVITAGYIVADFGPGFPQ